LFKSRAVIYWKATSTKLRSLRLCSCSTPCWRSSSSCADADAQVLVHPFTVEMVGHAGQLDFAMQWFVAHAQQRAIGHPKAKAVGGNGGAFHVQRHGAALAQAALRGGPLRVGSNSQLRLSVLATVPVRMMLFSSCRA
jgi:hypothetical protein